MHRAPIIPLRNVAAPASTKAHPHRRMPHHPVVPLREHEQHQRLGSPRFRRTRGSSIPNQRSTASSMPLTQVSLRSCEWRQQARAPARLGDALLLARKSEDTPFTGANWRIANPPQVANHCPTDAIVPAATLKSVGQFYSRAELLEQRQRWKREGKTVVFTNGCYDLLHPGHVRLLEQARSLGDVLILALNSDASVRRMKGPSRPLIAENERAAMALALAAVDAVTLFDEDTPRELIAEVLPDVHGGEGQSH